MAEPKTRPTDVPVDEFLAGVDEPRRSQALVVRELMTRATGVEPVMWGSSIVGYGTMLYDNTTGSGYEWPGVGFSPRKTYMTLYVLDGGEDEKPQLARLGPHTTGKSCLYLKRLDGVDLGVLEKLVHGAWTRWN
jgi:hypothetical protein